MTAFFSTTLQAVQDPEELPPAGAAGGREALGSEGLTFGDEDEEGLRTALR
jgi:hypothetical protein